MNRVQFLKTIGLIFLPATLSASQTDNVKYYSHDEIFYRPFNNPILLYFKEESDIYRLLEHDVVGKVYGSFSCFLGAHDFVLPKKEQYTVEDFLPLRTLLKTRGFVNKTFSLEKGTFLRMIYDKNSNSYYPDFFLSSWL